MMKRIATIFACLAAMTAAGCSDDKEKQTPPPPEPPSKQDPLPTDLPFYKGTTMSFASYMQDTGLVYRENGVETDPYESVGNHGANIVRLQLDMVPFDDYAGVKIDWQSEERVFADAAKARDKGLGIMLTLKPDCDDFSSSVTKHNLLPEPLAGQSEAAIGEALYDWVYGVLERMTAAGIHPAITAVGNEVNIDFMGTGSGADAARAARLLQYGHRAVRDYAARYDDKALSAVHIADPSKADFFLDAMKRAGATDFDIIALSYYPGSDIGHTMGAHTSFKSLGTYFAATYGKPIMVLETAYTFTTGSVGSTYMGDWCTNAYNYPDWNDAANAANYTPARQREWLRALAEDVKAGGGIGLITWGTESLPDEMTGVEEGHGKGLYTYPAAWAYGSTWENNSYWDFTDNNNLHEGIDWMSDVE